MHWYDELNRLNEAVEQEPQSLQEADTEDKAAKLQEYEELLKTYISKVNPEAIAAYEAAAGVSAEEGIYLKDKGETRPKTWRDKPILKIGVCFKGWNKYYPVLETKFTNEAAMLKLIEEGCTKTVSDIQTKLNTEKFNQLDVFAKNQSASVILLGESGTLYELHKNYYGEIIIHVAGEVVYSISEPYEVIYTRTDWSNDNHFTYRDNESKAYFSWNSSHADKLDKFIPTSFGRSDGFMGSYTETSKVTEPDQTYHSTADGINTWAVRKTHETATD